MNPPPMINYSFMIYFYSELITFYLQSRYRARTHQLSTNLQDEMSTTVVDEMSTTVVDGISTTVVDNSATGFRAR